MSVITRRPADDRDVRLRLGPDVEADRTLDLDEPAISKGSLESPRDEHHRGTVCARMRLLDEQQSIEQLDRIVLIENAAIDQLGVLVPRPAIQRGPSRLLHARMLSTFPARVTVAAATRRGRARVARRRRRAGRPAASTPAAAAPRHATRVRRAAPERVPAR